MEHLLAEISDFEKAVKDFNDQLASQPQNRNPTVRNLAADPDAARLSAAQLRVVDGRIANLQRAIALLGDSNPEWAHERNVALEEWREDWNGLSRECVNLVFLGFAEGAKRATTLNLSDARINFLVKAFKEPLKNLPSEEARLDHIMATTEDPALTAAIVEYKAALHRLRDAQRTKDIVGMVALTRDAADALKSGLEIMKSKARSADVADALYGSSAFLGSLAIVFVTSWPEAIAAATGSALSSVAVGGRELVNLWQERGQLATLDQSASDRSAMRLKLNGRLNELQEQRERFVWAVQHAAPADSPH